MTNLMMSIIFSFFSMFIVFRKEDDTWRKELNYWIGALVSGCMIDPAKGYLIVKPEDISIGEGDSSQIPCKTNETEHVYLAIQPGWRTDLIEFFVDGALREKYKAIFEMSALSCNFIIKNVTLFFQTFFDSYNTEFVFLIAKDEDGVGEMSNSTISRLARSGHLDIISRLSGTIAGIGLVTLLVILILVVFKLRRDAQGIKVENVDSNNQNTLSRLPMVMYRNDDNCFSTHEVVALQQVAFPIPKSSSNAHVKRLLNIFVASPGNVDQQGYFPYGTS